MEIELIRKSEIVDYTRRASKEFVNEIPLTIPRALSQSVNPDARENDVLLIVMREGNKLLAFIGRYPSRVQADPEKRIFWVSCWWRAKGTSSDAARAVFAGFLEISGMNVGLPHLPPHIIKTLEQNDIHVSGRNGLLLRFRSALHQRSFQRSVKGNYKKAIALVRNTGILRSCDFLVNHLRSPVIISRNEKTDPGFNVLFTLPGIDFFSFIHENFREYITIPYRENVKWIIENPWLVKPSEADNETVLRYHFSYITGEFYHFFPVLKENGIIKGTGFFSVRDGAVKSLFLFVLPEYRDRFLQNITFFIQQNRNYHSLITYDPLYYHFLLTNTNKRIPSIPIKRYTGTANPDYAKLQATDGDGDSCFT